MLKIKHLVAKEKREFYLGIVQLYRLGVFPTHIFIPESWLESHSSFTRDITQM